MRHISEFPVPGFGRPVEMQPVEWLHMCEMDIENFANKNLSVVVARCWYLGCVVQDKASRCSVYRTALK